VILSEGRNKGNFRYLLALAVEHDEIARYGMLIARRSARHEGCQQASAANSRRRKKDGSVAHPARSGKYQSNSNIAALRRSCAERLRASYQAVIPSAAGWAKIGTEARRVFF
jgi:hypothetical protein